MNKKLPPAKPEKEKTPSELYPQDDGDFTTASNEVEELVFKLMNLQRNAKL